MADMEKYTETITIAGEDYQYDPLEEQAIVYCDSCGQPNEVSVSLVDGEYIPSGFVCEHCGAWNAPPE